MEARSPLWLRPVAGSAQAALSRTLLPQRYAKYAAAAAPSRRRGAHGIQKRLELPQVSKQRPLKVQGRRSGCALDAPMLTTAWRPRVSSGAPQVGEQTPGPQAASGRLLGALELPLLHVPKRSLDKFVPNVQRDSPGQRSVRSHGSLRRRPPSSSESSYSDCYLRFPDTDY